MIFNISFNWFLYLSNCRRHLGRIIDYLVSFSHLCDVLFRQIFYWSSKVSFICSYRRWLIRKKIFCIATSNSVLLPIIETSVNNYLALFIVLDWGFIKGIFSDQFNHRFDYLTLDVTSRYECDLKIIQDRPYVNMCSIQDVHIGGSRNGFPNIHYW